MKHSYKDISEIILDPFEADARLNRTVVLDYMTGELPPTPWADIEILDWLPEDDKLPVEYCFADTPFGRVLVANTCKGVCYLGLVEGNPESDLLDFNKRFSHTSRIERQTFRQQQVFKFLDGERNEHISFHLRGTSFQTEIWRRLIRIPFGKVISYTTLGGNARSSRAAGAANGRNPIFWIVPCQRVVKTDGGFDRYFWGEDVKKRLLAWEFANCALANKCLP